MAAVPRRESDLSGQIGLVSVRPRKLRALTAALYRGSEHGAIRADYQCIRLNVAPGKIDSGNFAIVVRLLVQRQPPAGSQHQYIGSQRTLHADIDAMIVAYNRDQVCLQAIIVPGKIAGISLAQSWSAACVSAIFQPPVTAQPRPLADRACFGP